MNEVWCAILLALELLIILYLAWKNTKLRKEILCLEEDQGAKMRTRHQHLLSLWKYLKSRGFDAIMNLEDSGRLHIVVKFGKHYVGLPDTVYTEWFLYYPCDVESRFDFCTAVNRVALLEMRPQLEDLADVIMTWQEQCLG